MTVDSGANVSVPLPWILDATVPTVPIQPLLFADMYGMTTEFLADYIRGLALDQKMCIRYS